MGKRRTRARLRGGVANAGWHPRHRQEDNAAITEVVELPDRGPAVAIDSD